MKTTKNFESLSIEGIPVSLETPQCDLKWAHCQGVAVSAIRVHGCAFHFACGSCEEQMRHRVTDGFKRFGDAKCKRCGVDFSHENYYKIFPL